MPQFSRNTIIELVEALRFSTHSQIELFLIKFEMDEANQGGGIEPRKVGIIRYLINNPDKLGPFGANLIVEIIEHLLEQQLTTTTWPYNREPEEVCPKLVNSLKRDGYTIENGKLKTMLPETLQIAEKEDELTNFPRFGHLCKTCEINGLQGSGNEFHKTSV